MNKKENIIIENIINNFGSNLRILRKQSSLTLQDLSDELGLSKQILSEYENSKKYPTLYNLIKIAYYFNCSLDSLVFTNTEVSIKNLNKLQDSKEIVKKLNLNLYRLESISKESADLISDSIDLFSKININPTEE